jgi:hypothetical protein
VDLANALGASPWFTLPHTADDDYQRQFAALVKARLRPDVKVYVEWSNEVRARKQGEGGRVQGARGRGPGGLEGRGTGNGGGGRGQGP